MFLDTVRCFVYRKTLAPINLSTRTLVATLDGALAPMVSPGYVLLSRQFGVSVDEVASSFGSILLGLGCFM